MEQNLLDTIPQNKVYPQSAIQIGTFLGGPIVASYLISENNKLLAEEKKSKIAWVYGVAATIVIFALIYLIPGASDLPTFTIPVIYTAAVGIIVQNYQARQIKKHIEGGGPSYSIGRSVIIGLIGALVSMAII